MENHDRSEWLPTCLCENPKRSSPKESVPDLSNLVVVWGAIVMLWISIYTVFAGLSSDVPGYDISLVMILTQNFTGQRYFSFRHRVTFAFLAAFFCVLNAGYTLSTRFTLMITCQRKSLLRIFVQFLCSGWSAVSCKCGTLDWLGWTSGDFSGVALICSPVFFAVG